MAVEVSTIYLSSLNIIVNKSRSGFLVGVGMHQPYILPNFLKKIYDIEENKIVLKGEREGVMAAL